MVFLGVVAHRVIDVPSHASSFEFFLSAHGWGMSFS